jgi:Ion channel
MEVALGLLIGFVEGWSVGEAVYFSFVTGLTIGYGDIVPRQTLTHFQEHMPYGPFVPPKKLVR